jgi:hypothetical protein
VAPPIRALSKVGRDGGGRKKKGNWEKKNKAGINKGRKRIDLERMAAPN